MRLTERYLIFGLIALAVIAISYFLPVADKQPHQAQPRCLSRAFGMANHQCLKWEQLDASQLQTGDQAK